jgi:hypothetical protein
LCQQTDGPLHLKDFAKYIGTKDLSRACHHMRRTDEAGAEREIGLVKAEVAMDWLWLGSDGIDLA